MLRNSLQPELCFIYTTNYQIRAWTWPQSSLSAILFAHNFPLMSLKEKKKSCVTTCKREEKKKKDIAVKRWTSLDERVVGRSIRVRVRQTERREEKKKSQQGQTELWEKRWFRSFSAHPAERRCDSMPLPPNRPVCSFRRGDLCAPNRERRLYHLFTMCIYTCRLIFIFFTVHVRLIYTFAGLCQVVNNGNGQARPVPDTPTPPPPRPDPFFYIYLFIYFIPYESLWPGELHRFTVVSACVCVCACPSTETH